MQTIHFATAEHYIRKMHPEYNFVFAVEPEVLACWVNNAYEHAKRLDNAKGINIVIEDDTGLDAEWPYRQSEHIYRHTDQLR